MNKKYKKLILEALDDVYGKQHICHLHHEKPYELLFATILSAQCTDERVNIVTKDLFKKYTCLEDFAEAPIKELEEDIHSTGFYRNKAKNIKACAGELLEKHHGELPEDIEQLTSLPGVGRKTANVVRGHIFNTPSVVVDTHVKRISNKLGFTQEQDPVKIEFELMEELPKEHWSRFNTQIITHGRSVCTARSPKCDKCFLLAYCPWGLKNQLEKLEN